MRNHFNKWIAAVCLLVLCGCTGAENVGQPATPDASVDSGPAPFTVSCSVPQSQETLDPALASVPGSETILLHLYENLMRWEDDGEGYARLTCGQAESYTLETDYAGNATYTFTLRGDITWSNGKPVTAGDFVSAWRRLADPATGSPHRSLLRMVAGFDQVQETGDTSLLAVSAPDDATFIVTLQGSCAYFLEEVCAGAWTMPTVRATSVAWGRLTDEDALKKVITNGPYTLTHFSGDLVTLSASDTYYAANARSPKFLHFVTETDPEAAYGHFVSSQLHLVQDLPSAALETLSAESTWLPEAVTSTYGVTLNTRQPPFDDPVIRRAFALAVNPQAVVDALGTTACRPASGLVSYGTADYGPRVQPAVQEKPDTLPDPNAAPTEETPPIYWDFRTHSQELVTQLDNTDYAESCRQAQALMAQAGYAGGGGFPVVEYIYLESEANRAVALALQAMWKEQLGVTVTVRGLSRDEYDAMLTVPAPEEESGEAEESELLPTAPYQMAGMDFTAAYSDAMAFLGPWHSTSSDNLAFYRSDAFDILLDSANAAVSFEARDAYLHDAEAILLTDAPVIPLYYRGGSYLLSDTLTGLYRAPNGVFFLTGLTRLPG